MTDTEDGLTLEQLLERADDIGQRIGQVLGSAGELSRQAETLRGQVNEFLAKVRAA